MQSLLSLLALVLGWGIFQFYKRSDAENKLNELNFKKQLDDLNKGIASNNQQIQQQVQQQQQIETNLQKQENTNVSKDDLLNFLDNNTKQ